MLLPAFILGIISSLHCVGMCGPLALSLPRNDQNKFYGPLLYNLGRITTYASLGIFFGTIGRSLSWFGWQQKISIALGLIIFISILAPKFIKKNNSLQRVADRFMLKLRKSMSQFLFQTHPVSLYAFGLLNGLLPCGMVYMALAGAIATGHTIQGAIFMALFGFGTLPAMWVIAFSGNIIKSEARKVVGKLYVPVMILMAIILIIRGLNLDIPYFSPSLHVSHAEKVICPPDKSHYAE
ncbi:MAG: sulfite exporter TauE/SafE family protein [Chitinophagaceae bacterium]